jgi:hypothetical protein
MSGLGLVGRKRLTRAMICPFCGNPQPLGKVLAECPLCGRKLAVLLEREDGARCPTCHGILVWGAGFCHHCASLVPEGVATAPAIPAQLGASSPSGWANLPRTAPASQPAPVAMPVPLDSAAPGGIAHAGKAVSGYGYLALLVLIALVALGFTLMNKGCAPLLRIGGGRPTTPGGYIDRNFSQPLIAVDAVMGSFWGIPDPDPVATWEQRSGSARKTSKTNFKFGIYPGSSLSEYAMLGIVNMDTKKSGGQATFLATANLGSGRDPCLLSEWQVSLSGSGHFGITFGGNQYWLIEVP